ncbi:MAG TPA: hypothetical protein VFR63_13745 [Gaiellaceae bacterium]|nr:hypothetical protein [Gaiellaceae bacterium]
MESDVFDALAEPGRSAAPGDEAAESLGRLGLRTAALLRREGRFDLALELLDEVVERFRDPDVETAAYAAAVGIHCDRGQPATGLAVGRALWETRPSVELGYALVRAYWERFEETCAADDRDDWLAFKDELDALHDAAP